MKILIGTPIHQIKDYSMERWLMNVARVQKQTPSFLLLVDNSPGLDYVEKVRGYCIKHNIKNYKIEHIEVNQENGADERIGRSREIIRQEVLSGCYDAWFSWECDQLIPLNTIDMLSKIMLSGNYMMVNPNSWTREIQSEFNANFGCCLISRSALEKYGFLLEYPDMPNCWHGGEVWFKKQIIKGGGSYIELYGIIKPISHLDAPRKTP
jgi:hypothetical protein